ncbi:maleylpyruvate isomerase family mycothiol-dependent enzyme, partial [Streptomyces sp. T-3]|nr:maleylpyruvate isomerase family mycothiol-dependent enzyme [Streptomyces sp. T-3]
MGGDSVLGALRAESARLYEQVSGLPEAEWERPSPCPPWSVREVFAHLTAAVERVGVLLDEPVPAPVPGTVPDAVRLITAAEYCAPAERFTPVVHHDRIEAAQLYAARFAEGRALAEHFDGVWRAVADRCAREPESRVVVARHGEAMRLGEFLLTRVVEVCVHGFDVARGLGHAPWPSEEAADAVCRLLLGRSYEEAPVPGWDRTTFLRKATGRLPMTGAERAAARRAGVRWLTPG